MPPKPDIREAMAVYGRLAGTALLDGEKIVQALRRSDEDAQRAFEDLKIEVVKIGDEWTILDEEKEIFFLPFSAIVRTYRSRGGQEPEEIYEEGLPMTVRSLEATRLPGEAGGLVIRSLFEPVPPYHYDQVFVGWGEFRVASRQLAVVPVQELAPDDL